MVGRVGHFENAVNGVYVRVKGMNKKDDVRMFYEKTDGVLLCYGSAAWKTDEKEDTEKEPAKAIKGWMIGWYQDMQGSEEKSTRLFIAARCQMGDNGGQNFVWEVRDVEGDFQSDESTQLVLLPDARVDGETPKNDAPSPGRVTLRLADEAGLHPDQSPTAASLQGKMKEAASPLGAMSPYAYPPIMGQMGFPFGMNPFLDASALAAASPHFGAQQQFETTLAGKKKKNKKGKKEPAASPSSAGLRADAPSFIPGAAMMAPPFPFMPYPPPQDFFRNGGMRPNMMPASPMVAINTRYMSPDEETAPAAPPAPAAEEPKMKEPSAPPAVDGLTSKQTGVVWRLAAVKAKLSECKKGEGVTSPEFTVTKDSVVGPPMQLTVYPHGHPMSPSACVAVMLECGQGARMKFKVFAGSQKSGPKVLMGNRFHVDFARSSVFGTETSDESASMDFDSLEVGLELLDWM
jgi:hypothetical protein